MEVKDYQMTKAPREPHHLFIVLHSLKAACLRPLFVWQLWLCKPIPMIFFRPCMAQRVANIFLFASTEEEGGSSKVPRVSRDNQGVV